MALQPSKELDLVDFHLYWFGTVRLATLARRLRRRDEETAGRLMERYAGERDKLHGLKGKPFFDPTLRALGWYTAPADFVPRNAHFAEPQTHDPDRLLAYLAAERGMLTPVPPGWKRPALAQRRSGGGRTPDFDEILPLDAPPELRRQAISAPVLRTLLSTLLPNPFEPMRPSVPKDCKVTYLVADRRSARAMTIVPIALTHDSFRWAIRALGPEGPHDFVLHRLTGCEIVEDALHAPEDPNWVEDGATVKLKPRDGLPNPGRIIDQYEMKGGFLEVRMRPAFVVYFLKRHQLETDLIDLPGAPPDSTFDIPGRRPHQQPLAIANPDEVRRWIPAGMRIPPRGG